MFKVVIKKRAQRGLDSMPNDLREKMLKKIHKLADEPRPHGCTQLVGLEDTYRIRQGKYRAVYVIQDDVMVVEIVDVDNRASVYK